MTTVQSSPGVQPGSSFSSTVPVVGIGASAGGLAPITEFLASVSADSGFAFVIIQHLAPGHPGLLSEVLAPASAMPVLELRDGMAVQAGRVYVIPSDSEISFDGGRFTVRSASGARRDRRPIDHFFLALAQHCRQRAVAMLLSGMGSDGARGMAAVRDGGGLTLAQLPSSAQFDAMPASAIGAGVVDIIALPAQMGSHIERWWQQEGATAPPLQAGREDLQQLFQLLRRQTGANFADYKLSTVLRRVDRRMKLHHCTTLNDYLACVRDNPGEVELLFKELLIGVTQFFRDPKVWQQLITTVLPPLLAAHPAGGSFKAWVPACSTGEEAYTLAIAFREAVDAMPALPQPASYSLQIFATDLDGDAVERARQGMFSAEIRDQVPAALLQRYFLPMEQSGYRITKELRSCIIFARQNVISDPPFTKLDILCCRNLLIYFTPRLQAKLIPLFHYALKPDGVLVLGSADTPGHFSELFAPVVAASRIFRRIGATGSRVSSYIVTPVDSAALPSTSESQPSVMSNSLQHHIDQQLLQKHTPAAVVVNGGGDILYIHGRTGAFLEPAAGKANWNIHAMARDSVRHVLADLLQRASDTDGVLSAAEVTLLSDSGKPQHTLALSAERLHDDALEGSVLLTFLLRPAAPARRRGRSGNPQVQELERQLAQARLEIQAVRAEMQASREELRSANEELQSTNEELQSTNEELVTSKEEMQSLNEELYTVNAELQSKVDDLSVVNGDMKNLLNSTDIATIFLDAEMRIRRFTDRATQIYKLIASDVQRPLGDINNDLDYPGLEQDAREVQRTLVFCERQIPTRGGRWFSVRIMPYRTVDNVIDGVVLTFVNITEAKQLEARLRALQGEGEEHAWPAAR